MKNIVIIGILGLSLSITATAYAADRTHAQMNCPPEGKKLQLSNNTWLIMKDSDVWASNDGKKCSAAKDGMHIGKDLKTLITSKDGKLVPQTQTNTPETTEK